MDKALVIFHTSSLDSFAAAQGKQAARLLGESWVFEARDFRQKNLPVIFVTQGWNGSREEEMLRELPSGVVMFTFDEDLTAWQEFMPKLIRFLHRRRVQQVTLGGLWYTEAGTGGCVVTAQRYLRDAGFRVHIDLTLVNCEDDSDDSDPKGLLGLHFARRRR